MTTLPEEAVKAMPERIYAKTHGASTDVISGQRGLIGGWTEHKRDGQIEYVRSDLIATYQAAVLEKAVQIAERPVIGFSDGAVEASRRIASSIRSLSSPDHNADAGKLVEGDGWLPIESAPKDGTVIQVWHQVHKCPISVLWKDDGFPYRGKRLNWYERTYTTAWPEHVFFYWRPLPSAPASEGAE